MMSTGAKVAGLALAAMTVAGAARAEDGNWFSNILKYGGTTVPPSQKPDLGEVYCPTVDVGDNGAALRTFAGRTGDNASLRTQVTLGRLARDCTRLADGAISVKVGVEGQVLLGPMGKPGRYEAPVQFALKANGQTLATRSHRVAVSIGAGEAQGLFSVIEDNLVVPRALSETYEIWVSLGSGSSRPAVPRKRKAPAVAAPAEAQPDAAAAQ